MSSTHPVLDTVLVLDPNCISCNSTYPRENTPTSLPTFPNSSTSLITKLQLMTLHVPAFFSSFPSNKLPNPVNTPFPFPTLAQTTAFLPFIPIRMPPPEFSAKSTDIITSVYLLKACGCWTCFLPSLHKPGLQAYTSKALCLHPLSQILQLPRYFTSVLLHVVSPSPDSRLLEDTNQASFTLFPREHTA